MIFTVKKTKNGSDKSDFQTLVYIDYESLFYGMYDKYNMKPNLNALIDELKTQGRFAESIKVFGDFSKEPIKSEQGKIRTITNTIIDCQQPGNEGHKKDYTDFLMLDMIYQDSMTKPHVDQFIFVTGDNHYSSVATFLRTQKDKIIGVYAVEGTLGAQLFNCSSWVKTLIPEGASEDKVRENLVACMKNAEEKNFKSTFNNTVRFASDFYGGDFDTYRKVLMEMIAEGAVTQQMEETLDHTPIRTIRLKKEEPEQEPAADVQAQEAIDEENAAL
jgi:hypothetical protein